MKKAIKNLISKMVVLGAVIVLGISSTTVAYATETEAKDEEQYKYIIHWNDAYGYMHSFGCDSLEQIKRFTCDCASLGYFVTTQNPNYDSCEYALFNAGINCDRNSYFDYDENGNYYAFERPLQTVHRKFEEELWVDSEGKIDESFFETKFFKDCRYYIQKRCVSGDLSADFFNVTKEEDYEKDWYFLFNYDKKEIPVETEGDEYGKVNFRKTFERHNLSVDRIDFSLPENQYECSTAQLLKVSETSELALDYYMEQEETLYVYDDTTSIIYFTVDWNENYEYKKVVCEEASYVNKLTDKNGNEYYEAFFDFSAENKRTEPVTIKLLAEKSSQTGPVPTTTPESTPTPPTEPADDVDADKINILLPIVLAITALAGAGGYYFLVLLPEKKMIKLRGVWAEDVYYKGIKIKGSMDKDHPELWFVPSIWKSSSNRTDFVTKLMDCGTCVFFPADTVISVVTADGCTVVKDETDLFKKIAEFEQITAVTFVSESKGFKYAVNLK